MNKQLIQLLGAGVVSSALIGCGGVDGSNAENRRALDNQNRDEATLPARNISQSVSAGTQGLCSGMRPDNCNNYAKYAQLNIFSTIPAAEVDFLTPPQFAVTEQRIAAIETNIEGTTWDADRLANLQRALTALLENPQDEEEINVYDGLVDGDLNFYLRNGILDAENNIAYFGEAPAGFETDLDILFDVWEEIEDQANDQTAAEFEAVRVSLQAGDSLAGDTHTINSDRLAKTKAFTGWANPADVALILDELALDQTGLAKDEIVSQFQAVSVPSLDLVINDTQTVYDDLLSEDGLGSPNEPWPLYEAFVSGDTYVLNQNRIDRLVDNTFASAATVTSTLAIINEMKKVKDLYDFSDGGEYADRNSAYAAFKADFLAAGPVSLTAGEIAFSGFNSAEQSAVTAYFKDRPETDKREVAAVADSKDRGDLVVYFDKLAADIKNFAGDDAKVGIYTAANANPYQMAEIYGSIFELKGLDVQWIPSDASLQDAASCDDLYGDVAVQAGVAGLELDYPELAAQHLAACNDPTLITDAINAVDAIYIPYEQRFEVVDGEEVEVIDEHSTKGTASLSGADYTLIETRYNSGELFIAASGAGSELLVDTSVADDRTSDYFEYNALLTAPFSGSTGLSTFDFGIIETEVEDTAKLVRLMALAQDQNVVAYGLTAETSVRVEPVADSTNVNLVVSGNGLYLIDSITRNGDSLISTNVNFLTEGDIIVVDSADNSIVDIQVAQFKTAGLDLGVDFMRETTAPCNNAEEEEGAEEIPACRMFADNGLAQGLVDYYTLPASASVQGLAQTHTELDIDGTDYDVTIEWTRAAESSEGADDGSKLLSNPARSQVTLLNFELEVSAVATPAS